MPIFQILNKRILKLERAIPPKGGSRAFCDRMNAFAQKQGLPGMGYIFWRVESGKIEGVGPIAKNIGEKKTEELRSRLNLGEGDAAFFLGGSQKNSSQQQQKQEMK